MRHHGSRLQASKPYVVNNDSIDLFLRITKVIYDHFKKESQRKKLSANSLVFFACLVGWFWLVLETVFLSVSFAVLELTSYVGGPQTQRDPQASAWIKSM